jgi:putative membrane protein
VLYAPLDFNLFVYLYRLMGLKQKFSEQDLERIKTAVKDAEDKISGEIVPVIVEKSGFYTIASYKGSMIAAALVFSIIIVLDRYVFDASNTLFYDPVFIFILVLVAGVLGSFVPSAFTPLLRKLVTQRHLDHATRQRAENAFLEEEIFNTRYRTGIMIFISLFEREVIVMADKGISKVVEQKVWDKLVVDLVNAIRAGKIVDGLEGAIRRCGEVLLEKGFHKTDDDTNELRDDLRIDR